VAYKRKDDEARAKNLDQLTAEAQKLGTGYWWSSPSPRSTMRTFFASVHARLDSAHRPEGCAAELG